MVTERDIEHQRLAALASSADMAVTVAGQKAERLRLLADQTKASGNAQRLTRYRALLGKAEAEHKHLVGEATKTSRAVAAFAAGKQ